MALDEKTRETLTELGKNIAQDVALTAAVMIAKEAIETLLTTNYEQRDFTGNKIVAPTEDKALLDKKEADGNANKGTLAEDDVGAQKGKVDASDSDVKANQNEAKASTNAAEALNLKAGGMETATKGLKIN